MRIIIVIAITFSLYSLYAQSTADSSTTGTNADVKTKAAVATAVKAFREIELGMEIGGVKKLLLKDSLFNYRGETDVMFTPDQKQTIIECSGNSYIERAYFQFNDDKLFIITIVLNSTTLDYFTMFTTLSNKYGQPASLNPSEAIWNFSETRLSLEKPLRVKYIASKVFDKLKDAGKAEEKVEAIARDKFLEEF